jgi:ribosomal protein S18 acetylase RimI-like enzyme
MKWLKRLLELLVDWQYLFRRDSWQAALPQVVKAITNLPCRRLQFVIVARSLLTPLPDLPAKITLDMRPFTLADLDFVRQTNLPSEANLCAQRLQLGHRGLVACVNSRVAGYAWGCTDTSLEKVDLKIEPGDVLCTDAFTDPVFRGQGIQTTLSLARLRLFQELGYQRAMAYIEVNNKPSLAVWRKVGGEVIGHIGFKRIGFWRQTCFY